MFKNVFAVVTPLTQDQLFLIISELVVTINYPSVHYCSLRQSSWIYSHYRQLIPHIFHLVHMVHLYMSNAVLYNAVSHAVTIDDFDLCTIYINIQPHLSSVRCSWPALHLSLLTKRLLLSIELIGERLNGHTLKKIQIFHEDNKLFFCDSNWKWKTIRVSWHFILSTVNKGFSPCLFMKQVRQIST